MTDHDTVRPNWLDTDEYPFESRWFGTAGGDLHYVDEGSGPAVVMVHGNPAWSFMFRRLVKLLARDHRCVAVDHIGFGLSDKPAAGAFGYLPEDHAANVEALIDELDLTDVTLVVHDWGGPIGLAYAAAHPDNVSRVVIINTWCWPVDHDWYYVAFSGFVGGPIGRWLIDRRNFFVNTIMPMGWGDCSKLSDHVHEQYVMPLADPADRVGCEILPGRIVGSTQWLAGIWERLPAALADKPVLVVWGLKDIAFRKKELDRWISALPHARVVTLPAVGHDVPEEAPAELAEAIVPFLSAASSSGRATAAVPATE